MWKKRTVWAALALLVTVAAGWTAAPPRGKAPAKREPAPDSTEGIVGQIKGDKLRAFIPRIDSIAQMAGDGNFKGALAMADKSAVEVMNLAVVREDIAARAILSAIFTGLGGNMQAALGQTRQAMSQWRRVESMEVPKDLKAMAIASQGLASAVVGDYGTAEGYERRARGIDQQGIAPAMAAMTAVERGDAAGALSMLRPWLGRGSLPGWTSLAAGVAALCVKRVPEASNYLQGQVTKREVGYLPLWYLATGLAEAASGSIEGARIKFTEGSSREYGRFRPTTVLLALVNLAAGQDSQAAGEIRARMRYAPTHYQVILNDLLARPDAARARAALAEPKYWLTVNGYSAGGLSKAPAVTPPPPPAPLVEKPKAPAGGGGAPAAPGAPEAPAAKPGGDQASGEPAKEEGPSGIDTRALSTQAAQAYQAALRLIANGCLAEAEAALASSVRMSPLPEACLALGQLRFRRGDVARARYDYAAAVSLRPQWADAVFSLATAEDALTNAPRAVELYQQALKLGLGGEMATYASQRLSALGGR